MTYTHVFLFVSFSILSFYPLAPIIIAFVQQLLAYQKRRKRERRTGERGGKLYITLTSFSLQWVSKLSLTYYTMPYHGSVCFFAIIFAN